MITYHGYNNWYNNGYNNPMYSAHKNMGACYTRQNMVCVCVYIYTVYTHTHIYCYGLHVYAPHLNSYIKALIPSMADLRLNEIIRVGPWSYRISVLLRRDSRARSLSVHKEEAMWGHGKEGLSTSQEESSHQKLTLPGLI